MVERQALVIACNDVAGSLTFIPELPERLYEALINPLIGDCCVEGSVCRVNISADEIRAAIGDSFLRAAKAGRDLILYFIGHGVFGKSGNFYFGESAESGVDIRSEITKQIDANRKPKGLAIVLDTCHSGEALPDLAQALSNAIEFAFLAAVVKGAAYDGDFTRTVLSFITDENSDSTSQFFQLWEIADYVGKRLKDRNRPAANQAKRAGLQVPYLAKNVTISRALEVGFGGRVLPKPFQPTRVLSEAVAAVKETATVHITGPLGCGKTTLAMALSDQFGADGRVPLGFINAVGLLTSATNIGTLAEQLQMQLAASSIPFRQSMELIEQQPTQELDRLDPLERRVLMPLSRFLLPSGGKTTTSAIRLVFDGLGEPGFADEPIHEFIRRLSSLPLIRLVLMGHSGTALPGVAPRRIEIPWADESELRAYLCARGIEQAPVQDVILQYSERNWKRTELLADLAVADKLTPDNISRGLAPFYDALIEAVVEDESNWTLNVRPVLGTIAVAGTSPVLPLSALCRASAKLGGTEDRDEIRKILVRLRALVTRRNAGREDEHVGLAQGGLARHLLSEPTANYGVEQRACEQALIDALEELSPKAAMTRDAVSEYAWTKEPEHLWNLGRRKDLLESLRLRESKYPAQDLSRWEDWRARFEELGDHSVEALFADCQMKRLKLEIDNRSPESSSERTERINVDLKELEGALERLRLVHENSREHLWAALDWASFTGGLVSQRKALEIAAWVSDRARNFGGQDIVRLTAEYEFLIWSKYTSQAGDDNGELLKKLEDLLGRLRTALGESSRAYLIAEAFRASLIGETEPDRALGILSRVLERQRARLGKDDADVLTTRHAIVFYRTASKFPDQKARAFAEGRTLVRDQIQFFGRNHSDSIQTRLMVTILGSHENFIDSITAINELQELYRDARSSLDEDHDIVLRIRGELALLFYKAGRKEEAEALFTGLYPKLVSSIGTQHQLTKAIYKALQEMETGSA